MQMNFRNIEKSISRGTPLGLMPIGGVCLGVRGPDHKIFSKKMSGKFLYDSLEKQKERNLDSQSPA